MQNFGRTVWVAALTLALLAVAQMQSPPRAMSGEPEKDAEPVNPETSALGLYVGLWRAVESHFSESGQPTSSASGAEDVSWISDFHGIQRKYTSTTDTTRYSATGLLSFNAPKGVYQGVWIDSHSTTGPTTVEGNFDRKARVFTFTLERTSPDGSPVRYRVVERFETPETRTSTTYLVRGTTLVKQLEITFTRTSPCPSRIRVIFDNG